MISDPKGLMKLRFKCPKCGGHKFGTSYAGDWEKAVGHCHSWGCHYSWPRANDDALGVFVSKEDV